MLGTVHSRSHPFEVIGKYTFLGLFFEVIITYIFISKSLYR